MSGWTQPLCGVCWIAYDIGRARGERDYISEPTRVKDAESVPCALCGAQTEAGIYIRIDPRITRALAPLISDD